MICLGDENGALRTALVIESGKNWSCRFSKHSGRRRLWTKPLQRGLTCRGRMANSVRKADPRFLTPARLPRACHGRTPAAVDDFWVGALPVTREPQPPTAAQIAALARGRMDANARRQQESEARAEALKRRFTSD